MITSYMSTGYGAVIRSSSQSGQMVDTQMDLADCIARMKAMTGDAALWSRYHLEVAELRVAVLNEFNLLIGRAP